MAGVVGRDRELDIIERDLLALPEGRGGCVLVVGEAGIGKTTVAGSAMRSADERSFLTACGRAWDAGGSPPMWPWVQAIRSLVGQVDDALVVGALSPASEGVAFLVPELGRIAGIEDARERLPVGVFDATTRFLAALAQPGRPLVLLLEDLHAADLATLQMLQFAAPELRRLPVLVLATARDAEIRRDPSRRSVFGEIEREARVLPLAPLALGDLRSLAAAAGHPDPAAVAKELDRLSGGHPLLATELLSDIDAAAEGVPIGVRALSRRRLDALDPDDRHLAELIAVAADCASLPLLGAITGLAPDELDSVLRRLEGSGLLRARQRWDEVAVFRHELVRTATYDEIDQALRRILHVRVADAIEGGLVAADDDLQTVLAHHLVRGYPTVPSARVVSAARRAATLARARFALESAVEWHAAAAAVAAAGRWPEEELLRIEIEAISPMVLAGRYVEARRRCDRLAARARAVGSWALEADVLDARFSAIPFDPAGSFAPEGIAMLERCLAAAPPGEEERRLRLLLRLGYETRWSSDHPDPDATSASTVALARDVGDPLLLMRALILRANTAAGAIDPADWDAVVHEAADHASRVGDPLLVYDARVYRLMSALARGDRVAFDIDRGLNLRQAEKLRTPMSRFWSSVHAVLPAFLDGELEEAARRLDTFDELAPELAPALAPQFSAALRGGLLRRRFNPDDVDQLLAADDASGTAELLPVWRIVRPWVRGVLGDLDLGRAELHTWVRAIGRFRRDFNWAAVLLVAAEAATLLHDRASAAVLEPELRRWSGRMTLHGLALDVVGPADRGLGGLLAVLGDLQGAVDRLEAALDLDLALGDRWSQMWTSYVLAGVLLRRAEPGDHVRALELEGSARALGAAHGFDGWSRWDIRSGRLGPMKEVASEPSGAGPTMRLEGDVRTITHRGRTIRLRDTRGLQHLARLVACPGREVAALELMSGGDGLASGQAVGGLDAEARAAYRRRYVDLQEEIEEAESLGDRARAGRAEVELDALAHELSRSVGLGGRSRATGSPAERARVAVTRAVRAAIAKIAEHDSALAHHLDAHVSTGTFCCYRPEAGDAGAWTIEG